MERPEKRKASLEFSRKQRKESAQFYKKGQMKPRFTCIMGRKQVWRKTERARDLRHTTLSIKHGGSNITVWACMTASGNGPLFIDDMTADSSSNTDS